LIFLTLLLTFYLYLQSSTISNKIVPATQLNPQYPENPEVLLF